MGSRGDFGVLLATALRLASLKAGTGHLRALGLEPPGSQAFYPVSPNFAQPMLLLSVVIPPSRNASPQHPSPRCCATSQQRRRPCQGGKRESPLPALASAEIQVKADFGMSRAAGHTLAQQPSPPLPLLRAVGHQPEQPQPSTRLRSSAQTRSGSPCGSQRAPRYLQIRAELRQIYLLDQIYVAIPGRGE